MMLRLLATRSAPLLRPIRGPVAARRLLSTAAPPPTGDETGAAATAAPQEVLAAAAADPGTAAAVAATEPAFSIFSPTSVLTAVLDSVHATTGLPWVLSIAATTVMVRTVLFPLTVKQMRMAGVMQKIGPELRAAQEKYQAVRQDPEKAQVQALEMQKLFKRHNYNPLAALLPALAQMPVFVGFFLALRSMVETRPEMATQGALWFQDLTAADPYMALPVLSSLTFLVTIELGDLSQGGPDKTPQQVKLQSTMKNVFRGLAIVMVPATYHFPSAVFVYWMSSNTLSMLQTAVFKLNSVKRLFGIYVPSQADTKPGVQLASDLGASGFQKKK